MCTWSPTPRVRATFRTVFPHVLDVDSGVILIGSRYPIQLDLPAWEARLDESRRRLRTSGDAACAQPMRRRGFAQTCCLATRARSKVAS